MNMSVEAVLTSEKKIKHYLNLIREDWRLVY